MTTVFQKKVEAVYLYGAFKNVISRPPRPKYLDKKPEDWTFDDQREAALAFLDRQSTSKLSAIAQVGDVGKVVPAFVNSRLNRAGSATPCFMARFAIPAKALLLKKNCGGTTPVSSISDHEDSTACLGHSEELSVQDSVGEAIPEFFHRPEDGAKVFTSVR